MSASSTTNETAVVSGVMKALVFDGQLHLSTDYPTPQKDDEALVKVIRAGVCATDVEIARGYMNFNGILGHEFVGTVVAGHDELQGKRVVADINCVCHHCDMCHQSLFHHCRKRTVLGIDGRNGAFAEYLIVPRENLVRVRSKVTDDQAVFAEPLAAAIQVVRQHPMDADDRVAVLGPGRLGLLVAQVVKPRVGQFRLFGRSMAKAPICEALGLDLEMIDESTEHGCFDVVVECSGTAEGCVKALELVRPKGTVVLKSTYSGTTGPDLTLAVLKEVVVLGSRCGPVDQAIDYLAEGRVNVDPLITNRFPLADGLAAFQEASKPENVKVLIDVSE